MMFKMRPIISLLTSFVAMAFTLPCEGAGDSYKIVCYYTNWSQYRPGLGKFTPENIDPKLCTHIIYAFAKVTNSEIKTIEWNDQKMFQKLRDMKLSNPELKSLIAVGGWNAGSAEFTTMVDTALNRQKFITSVIEFLQEYGFDGLDLDWEYPAQRGGKPSDRDNFARLIQELKEAFLPHQYLLTAAVPAGKTNVDAGYNVPLMGRHMDFINLMSYDLHGSWEKTTGMNSPLYPSSHDSAAQRQLNMNWAADYWAKQGIPKHKLVIGMATYGRSFTLASPSDKDVGAPAKGPGRAGQYTRERGFLSYYEICKMVESGHGIDRWDNEQKVPYYSIGRLWVGYDNVKSITVKSQWLMKEGYGGAMIWALDLDDFGKSCSSSSRPYPLLNTINDILKKGTLPPTPKPHPTPRPRPTLPPTTIKPTQTTTNTYDNEGFTCSDKADGFYADPNSCHYFYRCISRKKYHYQCPANLVYNSITHVCDWPHIVPCKTFP
ncbi:hypothetical protein ACF0H5_000961 [Mactra antiquata]